MHTALDDHFLIDHGRLARQLQRVALDVGNAMVDFRRLVIVRQNDRVALLLELVDPPDIGRMNRPFDGRNVVLDELIKRRSIAGDLVGIGEIRHVDHAKFFRCAHGLPGADCRFAGFT